MGIMMGIMMVLMVAGFLGHGHHGGMMGDRGKEAQKEEVVIEEKAKETPVTGSESSGDSKQEESSDEQDRYEGQTERGGPVQAVNP